MRANLIFLLRVLISLGFHTECEKKRCCGDEFLLARCSICGFAPLSFTQATLGDRLCETCGVFCCFLWKARKVIVSYRNRSQKGSHETEVRIERIHL